MGALNAKHRLFVQEYLKDKNATRAYRAAGYNAHGNAAEAAASRLLRSDKVRAAVDAGLKKLEKKIEVSAERIVKRIAEFAFDKKTIKSSDTLKACELLGKHFKLFTDVTEITGKDGGPQIVAYIPDNGRNLPKKEEG